MRHNDLLPDIIGYRLDLQDNAILGVEDNQFLGIFANLERVLGLAGAGLEDIFKVTIYLTDMSNFPKIMELRERHFTPPYPADTIVEVRSLALPELMIEIEVMAMVPDGERRVVDA